MPSAAKAKPILLLRVSPGLYKSPSRSSDEWYDLTVTPVQFPDGHVEYLLTCTCIGAHYKKDAKGNSDCGHAQALRVHLEAHPDELPEPLRLPSHDEIEEILRRVS